MSYRPSVRNSLKASPSIRRSRQSLRQSLSRISSGPKRQSQILYKKKDKASDPEKETADKLKDLDISKYCPQKIFNVLFINEVDQESNRAMGKIIETSKEFQEVSYLTFITYDEVIDLAENCDNAVLPTVVKMKLKEYSNALKSFSLEDDAIIPPQLLARLMKTKLIEVMYGHYTKAVTKMQARKKLIADLKALTGEGVTGREKNVRSADLQGNHSLKKTDTHNALDFTSIPIETHDDIVFDDDINHHISYYVFYGFYDPDLLKELIVNSGVDIQAIVKISSANQKCAVKTMYCDFWDQIEKYFDGPKRSAFLENTFLMNYTVSGNDFKHTFVELLYVIRNITEVKLQHLNYVRHMEIFRGKEIYTYFPLDCFTVYNNFFQKFPKELINVPILLDTLLKQVSVGVDETVRFSGNVSQHSYLDINNFENSRCVDPCSMEAFFRKKVHIGSKPLALHKPMRSFLVYENDELFLILSSYKKYGPLVHDLIIKMLTNSQALKDFSRIEGYEEENDIIHKHDRDPSTKTLIQDKDIVMHFLYLFLFNLFRYKYILPKVVETELTKNLETFNKLDFIKSHQTQLLSYNDTEGDTIVDNLYNIEPSEYFWKEDLASPVLLQQMSKAEEDYLYCVERFSPETDTLLIQYSNCLDEFGVNTKIYDQVVLTPVCLRDFCKYTSIEQADWLENNKPPRYVRKCVVREECQGAKKLLGQKLFPEYSYLMESETQTQQSKSNVIEPQTEPATNIEISFEQLIEEIKQYPPNTKLVKECSKAEKQDKFLVYDFGTKYFQIRGAKTTFHSHDDVKLSIDNTALLDEHPKCSVRLDCQNNSLILHSGKFYFSEDYNFHMNLADGTIVSFIFYKSKKYTKPKDSVLFERKQTNQCQWESTSFDYEKYTSTVLSVDQDYFEKNIETSLLNEEYTSSTDIAFNPSESMLDRLKKAALSNVPIYKINHNLTSVRKLKSEFEIPLVTIVRRVLHNTISKVDVEAFTKRYLPIKGYKQQTEIPSLFDCRISLPNGLYVSLYPSTSKKDQAEVKQEFLWRNTSTELEEFRLFSRGGYILIKKIDGSVTLLKSNGDVIDHEKLDTTSDNVYKWRSKQCHCKNVEDYRKRVYKLFKSQNEDLSDATVSRRACFQTKKGYVVDILTANMIKESKIPYLKSTILKVDGTRVRLEADKVRVKKLLHLTSENNVAKKELCFERGDGLRCIIDRNAKQVMEFTDGTKITSTVDVANDLVDGYVYISLEFEFQHPHYATVAYKLDNNLDIALNNIVISKHDSDDTVVKIDGGITTTVTKETVVFEKECSECKGKYTCDINIQPLVSGVLDSDQFIRANDSYNKHFYADFSGKCIRNPDYIKGPLNAFNCDHYSRMCYNKLFVVNRNLTGCTFWTDKMVSAKKKATNPSDFYESNDPTNTKILIYKFKTNICDQYTMRFLNKSLIDNPKEVVYTTFCTVRRMVDVKMIEKFTKDMMGYFKKCENVDTRLLKGLEKMFKENEGSRKREEEVVLRAKLAEVKTEQCLCVKERISIRQKIERWRNECEKYRSLIRSRKLPCYFDSPFCKIIKK